jgi:NitT/TauT family transport system substrate-binding protein
MLKKANCLIGVTALALLVSACGGAPAASTSAEIKEVTVAITTASLAQKEDVAVFAVGSQLGYFEEEGIKIKTVNADGSSAALQAVAAGSADITSPDAGSILSAASKGVPVVAVGGLVQNWPWAIGVPVDSEIKKGADLKGKNVGVISLASGSAPYARAYAEDAGLNPASDVNLLPVGVGGQAASALTGGDVDALALYGQAYTAIEQAGVKLRYLPNSDRFDGLRSLTFATTKGKLSENTKLYEGFLRASYKALVFSAKNPEAAVQLGYKEFPQLLAGKQADQRLKGDTELLTTWIKSAIPTDVPLDQAKDWGAIPEADWTATQSFATAAGQITKALSVESFWDPKLLAAANNFDSSAILKEAAEYKSK